jgi:protein SCO1/2
VRLFDRLPLLIAAAAFAGVIVFLSACAHGNRARSLELLDDRGQTWALQDQPGGTIVVFGYTHCEDTCPLTLAKLSKALKDVEPSGGSTQIAFITVDPQRDTPKMLHAWLAKFGPQVVGLTGTPSQIESVERSYHVYAQKLPSRHGGYGYDEAHSSTIFFIDKDRYIVSLHDPSDSLGELAHAMRQL